MTTGDLKPKIFRESAIRNNGSEYATSSSYSAAQWNGVTVFQFDRVLYTVDNLKEPLARLYFCKYCLELRAEQSDQIQTEVDSHFCMHALDNVPPTEAILKKNKSRSFWQCPSCPSILNHKTHQVQVPNPDKPDEVVLRKHHFMMCAFCHWSTKDVGMEDAMAAGAWPEKENPNITRINEIIDYVKQVSSNQAFLARAKQNKRVSTRVTGKMSGLSPLLSMNLSMKDGKQTKIPELNNPVSLSLDQLTPLDPIYNSDEGINLLNVASLEQRFDQPEFQPESIKDLYPRRLTMGVKRSLRCKKCEHNLLKPEFSPNSIKFKIHLCASNQIPDIRILTLPDWNNTESEEKSFVLVITNPTHSNVTVTLLPYCEQPEDKNLPPLCGKLTLPNDSFDIPAKETITDLDSAKVSSNDVSDGSIRFRQKNKIGLNCSVALDPEHMGNTSEKWIGLRLKHDYLDTLNKKTEPVWLTHTIFINLADNIH